MKRVMLKQSNVVANQELVVLNATHVFPDSLDFQIQDVKVIITFLYLI